MCAAASPLRARGARVRVSGEAWAGTCHVPRREDGVGARWTRASRRRSTAAPATRLPVRTARLWLGTEPSQRLVSAPQQPSARSRCAVGSRPRAARCAPVTRFAGASTPIGPRREPSRSARRRASLARQWLSSGVERGSVPRVVVRRRGAPLARRYHTAHLGRKDSAGPRV